MCEIGHDVKLVYLIKTLDFVFGLSADSVPLDHPDVEVTSKGKGVEMLKSSSDTARANKWVVNKVSFSNLALIRHQKGKFMVS